MLMSATIWSRFFWSDWESDPALRLCSMAAQGLWMRMLCVAARSDPPGYVQVNGHPLQPEEIARMCGISTVEAVALLSDLDRHGVYSRDRRGCIFNRRIVRDVERAAKNRANGKKGGNPSLSNNTEKRQSLNPPDNPEDKPHLPSTNTKKDYKNLPSVVKGAQRACKGNRIDYGNTENRQVFARKKIAALITWDVMMAAEDPKNPDHAKAVKIARSAAQKAKVMWSPPE